MSIDYDSLIDRPRINGHVLTGNMSSEDLDIQGGSGNVDDVLVNGQSVVDEFKIAKIKSYKEVTQAEYNALPATKTEDGVMYCITDAHGAEGYPPLIYSDEEREVGVWRDGKPLYQRTWDFITDVNIGSWTNVMSVAGLNIDKLVNSISVQSDNAIPEIEYWIDGTTLRGNTLRDNGAGDYVRYLTLQYTKTTDTPGSGTWTTRGAYAHHYSASEHVVGTWVDGKPLYEKTFSGALTPSSSYITVFSLATYDIDNLVSGEGYVKSSTYHFAAQIGASIDSGWPHLGWYITSGGDFQIYYPANQALDTYAITLQYTKTTD